MKEKQPLAGFLPLMDEDLSTSNNASSNAGGSNNNLTTNDSYGMLLGAGDDLSPSPSDLSLSLSDDENGGGNVLTASKSRQLYEGLKAEQKALVSRFSTFPPSPNTEVLLSECTPVLVPIGVLPPPMHPFTLLIVAHIAEKQTAAS